jgi:hypothetical protein
MAVPTDKYGPALAHNLSVGTAKGNLMIYNHQTSRYSFINIILRIVKETVLFESVNEI